MTRSELAKFDGREGRSAYVAVSGTIYDVSTSPLWKDGDHQGAHRAGADLTTELQGAPHVRAVVERFPVVGRLEEEPQAAPAKPVSHLKAIMIAVVTALILFLAMKFSK